MVNLFRWMGRMEGVSFLLLLGIAMPLKYIWGYPQAVSVVGMAHGILFMGYVGLLFYLAMEHRWKMSMLIKGFFAAVLPLGTFFFEKAYLGTIEELAQKQAT